MTEIMRRELKLLLRERFMVFFVLMFAASAYALLIGNLYSGGIVQNIPVAVCDRDDSPLSRELVQMVAEADQYRFVGAFADEINVVSMLEREEIAAALIIPPDFSRKYYSGQRVDLAFLQDGANTLQAGYAAFPLQLIVSDFAAGFSNYIAISHEKTLPSAPSVSVSLRMHGNAVNSYMAFYMYGVMLMAAQIGMIMGFSMSVYEDLRQGYFEERGTLTVFSAKILLYLVLSLLSVLIGIFLLAVIFRMPFHGALWQLIILPTAFLWSIEGLAGIAAVYFKTRLALVQAMVFYALPAFLLSGYIWPEIGMVGVVKWISALQPVHYTLVDFRAVSLTGEAPSYWLHVGILLSVGLIAHCISYGFLRFIDRRMQG